MGAVRKYIFIYLLYQLLITRSKSYFSRPSHSWLGPHEILHETNISNIDFQNMILNTSDCNNEILKRKLEYPNCQIKSDHLYRSFCYGANTLITRTNNRTKEFEVICTASFPIEVEAKFQYDMPLPAKSKVLYERYVADNFNHSTYVYAIRLLPTVSGNSSMAKQIVKYYVRSMKYPGRETIVFISPDDIFEFWPARIDTTHEMLNIPCFSKDDTDIHIYRSDLLYTVLIRGDGYEDFGEREYTKILTDGEAIIYNPIVGFLINTTKYNFLNESDKVSYICSTTEPDPLDFRYEIVLEKLKLPDVRTTPDIGFIIVSRNASFNLSCDASEPVFMIDYASGVSVSEQVRSNDTGLVYLEYQDVLAQRFFAYYSNREHDRSNTNYVRILCQRKSDNTTLHKWFVKLVDMYDPKNQFLRLENEEDGRRVKCMSYKHNVLLQNIECNNPAMCGLTQKCLEEGYSCKKYIPRGSSCLTMDRDESCQVIQIVPHGLLKCSAGPFSYMYMYFQGFDHKFYTNWRSAPITAIMLISGEDKLHTNDSFTFTCKVHSFASNGRLQFLGRNSDGSIRRLISDTNNLTNPNEEMTVRIDNTSLAQIICAAPIWDTAYEWINVSMYVAVTESQNPTIKNQDTTKFFKIDGLNQNFICEANGYPRPEISWTRYGQRVQDPLHEVDNVISKILYFPTYIESMAGEYICSVHNVAGNMSKSFFAKTEEPPIETLVSPWTWIGPLVGVGCSLLVILIPAIIIVKRLKAVRWAIRQLSEEEVEEFFNGTLGGAVDDTSEADMEPGNIPFDTRFQIAKEDMRIDKNKILGIGEFGIVYGGRLETNSQDVAFKTAQQDLSGVAFRALLAELKIMIYIGHHSNVVQLLGAYVAEIRRGILYIATEFCQLGSLESFLRNGKIELGVGHNAEKNVELGNIFGTSQMWVWAYQIATGMEYLTNRKVIHSDLATRNVLLNKDRVAKITDFGLSRKLYERTVYVKTSEEPVPWRWLDVESIRHKIFSAQSDVWAFGITLWEIFSLGDIPYPGINWTMDFNRQLEMGLRNLCPPEASEELYAIMTNCWQLDPTKRPSFTELRDFLSKNKPSNDFEEQDENEDRTQYIDLGDVFTLTDQRN